ncbi:MAG: hypothetical protein ACP5NQ_01580 [Vulcanisaeta sp.]
MTDLLYIIKWEKCLDDIIGKSDVRIMSISEDGALVNTSRDDYLVNEILDIGCTVYARHYRFRLIKVGDLNEAISILRPFDAWVEDDVINFVVNPLRLSTLSMAKVLYGLGFDLELISESDVEFVKYS